MHPEGLSLIGPLGLQALADNGWRADSVGGLTLGADPVSYAIAYASQAGMMSGDSPTRRSGSNEPNRDSK